MAIDTTTPRSRRAILAATLGAGAATVATAVGRPLAVRATDGEPVMVGNTYTATTTTEFDASGGATALEGTSGSGTGVYGNSASGTGVYGNSASGWGVYGSSDSGYGVVGVGSSTNTGVVGVSTASNKPGILGVSIGSSTGVQGFSSSTDSAAPVAPAKTGVYGYAAQDGHAVGVNGQSIGGIGVYGSSTSGPGVHGSSTSGYGVRGYSTSGSGLYGHSTSLYGVDGVSESTSRSGILGTSSGGNTGVQGYSGAYGSQPASPAKTGVYGYAVQDAAASGVTGQSTAGYGVSGIATTGRGVNGTATTGNGVFGAASSGIGTRGWAATGTAGYFATSAPKSGTALRAIGRVKLDNCAGVVTIASGSNSVTVTPGSDLNTTSAVVATLMGSAGGTTTVHRVVVNATADTFTIYLTANATAAVTVAWHVFG